MKKLTSAALALSLVFAVVASVGAQSQQANFNRIRRENNAKAEAKARAAFAKGHRGQKTGGHGPAKGPHKGSGTSTTHKGGAHTHGAKPTQPATSPTPSKPAKPSKPVTGKKKGGHKKKATS